MLKMPQIVPLILGAMLFSNSSQAGSYRGSAHVPAREEVPAQFQWHLEDIYATEDDWQKDFDKLKKSLPELSLFKDKLGSSAQTLLKCLKLRDQIGITGSKLFAYARMHRDENTANAKYQALTGKTEALLAELGAATAFIEPEILALPEAQLTKMRREEPCLAEYNFYFENLMRQKQHILSPEQEEILSRAAEVTQAPENIYNMLAHADIKFPHITDEQGNKVQLSEGRYSIFIRSHDRSVRQQAFTGLFTTYNQYRNTFAATLGGTVKQDVFFAKTRKYDSALAAALQADNVPVAVYENMIQTVNNNLKPLHRYVALKQKVLKLDKIHMYDLYTPLVPDVKLDIPYEQGLELVEKGLAPLGPEYIGILKKGLTSGWVDVYENEGKQTGAYSWGVYGVHPFVLLNYNDRYDAVSTLAHEMGHAIHSYYSHTNQPYATSQYSIFTAEVASTTNEVLLLDYMLKTTDDNRKKMYLINQYLEAVRATVYRQTMFAEFEKLVHETAEQGETITADMLDGIWHELNVKYYGPDIVVDKENDIEWARIPHFYRNFYVYQYVTGYSAATTLAHNILTQGEPAQQKYLTFLKSGGSDYPINLLRQAGVDMSAPAPIELTLKKFAAMLDELENLLNKA